MLKNKELLEEKLISMMERFDKFSKLLKALSISSYSKIVEDLEKVKEKYIIDYEVLIQYDENEDFLWDPIIEEKKYQIAEDRAIKGMAKIKSLAISEKIDDIYYICKVIFKNHNNEKLQKLNEMKNTLHEIDDICSKTSCIYIRDVYKQINQTHNAIMNDLLEIEEVENAPENRLRVIEACIADIKQSENFKNFKNVEGELRNIERLKNILKSYIPYKNSKEIEKIKCEISSLKFDILIRMQVERLIYQNGNENNCLLEYDNEEEKEIFKELLEEKRKSLIIGKANSIENDKVLSLPIDRIYENTALLKSLLVIDMERNSYEYINLLKAPIFNAYLYNTANDSDTTTKNTFSLLKSRLPLITDVNISIAECENIYRKFGFECNPILFNIRQKCVKMIYDNVKDSRECETIVESCKKVKKNDGNYCKLQLPYYEYYFENEGDSKSLLSEILTKLDDASDFPIDYDKIRLISEKEIEKDLKTDDGR